MRLDRSDLRNELMALAASQSGYFTASQALAIGYQYPQHTFHTQRGNWVRVERKLYRLPHFPLGPHDDLVRASLWSMREGVPAGIVSHESAAAVHELGEIDPLRTHLTVPRTFRATHPSVVLHRDELPDEDVEARDGFLVTNAARTLVDLSDSITDADQLDAAFADALSRHLTTAKGIRAVADRVGGRAALQAERALGRVS